MTASAAAANTNIAGFVARLEAVAGTARVVDDMASLRADVAERCAAAGGPVAATEAAVHVAPPSALRSPTITELSEAAAAVSVGRLGVAETGSILQVPASRLQRLMLVVPPLQIVVLPLERLRASLDEAMQVVAELTRGADSPAPYVTFVTGPSRTADIERVITVGAHGPRRLHVTLVREWHES